MKAGPLGFVNSGKQQAQMGSIQTVLFVGAGGAVGAMSRFMLGRFMLSVMGPGYPWGTLAANVIGALIMGMLVELFALKISAPHNLQAALMVGVLGGFTTFSAFSLEATLMIQRNEWMGAISYALVSVVVCIAAVFAGMAIVRHLL
jgi:CrcB protein